MKTIVLYFIVLEILDVLTTVVGLSIGLVELNPLYTGIDFFLAKLLVTISISIILQKLSPNKLHWIVPLPVFLAVINNTYQLALSI